MCLSTSAETEGTDDVSEADKRSDCKHESGDGLQNDLGDDNKDNLEVDENANNGLEDSLVDELAF
jgi:hypothetical protein